MVVGEYLHVIYRIQSRGGLIKGSTLVSRMDSSPSTVHATIRRMERDELVQLNERKEIFLTEKGQKIAEDIAKRHNLIECFLWSELKIPWHQVHSNAHHLEHVVSPLVAEKLEAYLGFPKYCPHGSPMPGIANARDTLPLLEANPCDKIEIAMLDESLEDCEDLLKYLEDCHVIPGEVHEVSEKITFARSVVLRSEFGVANLPYDIAEKIEVKILERSF